MKKALALVLILMFCLIPALAEVEIAFAPYTSTIGNFTIDLPETYIPFNGELMSALLGTEEGQQALADAGFTDEMLAVLEQNDWTTTEIIYTDDMVGNLNMIVNTSGATMADLKLAAPLLDEEFASQYIAMGVAEEDIHPNGIVTIGEKEFYSIDIVMLGFSMQQYLTVDDAVGNMYTFTFTLVDPDIATEILNSLTFTD